MNNLIKLLLNQKLQQIPKNMMNQLEQQLKAQSPQAYQEFLKAKNDNVDPNEYLNKIVNGFSPEKKEQWNNMMGQFQQPKK